MVNWNTKSVKARSGLAKCASCGGFYDPTYGACPCQRKKFFTLIFAAIIVFFMLAPVDAGAQATPEPTPECMWIDGQWLCISHIEAPTPFVPTATATPELGPPPLPSATPTPTVVIAPLYRVRLPLIYR